MNVRLVREYRFEAAHRLPNVEKGHRCGQLHGHSYRVELALYGPVAQETGWLLDFADIDRAWAIAGNQLDHAVLNDVLGLSNPTCEFLTKWLWDTLRPSLALLCRVTVWETSGARCEYEGG